MSTTADEIATHRVLIAAGIPSDLPTGRAYCVGDLGEELEIIGPMRPGGAYEAGARGAHAWYWARETEAHMRGRSNPLRRAHRVECISSVSLDEEAAYLAELARLA